MGNSHKSPIHIFLGAVLGLLLGVCAPLWAGTPWQAHHELRIDLDPAAHTLTARDRIRLAGTPPGTLSLVLNARARVSLLRLDQQAVTPDTSLHDGLQVLRLANPGGESVIEIRYACRFDDPAPATPLNTDNPGYGVSGVIAPEGALLLSGSGWYPRLAEARESFTVTVEAPAGMSAVTQGRLTAYRTEGERTLTRWRIARAVEDLSLAAGPYVVRRITDRGVTLMTFFSGDLAGLSDTYLSAAGRHLAQFRARFGDYPFEKFAVVQNFFPTGYGFPSYTLMGGRVLQLPFIPHTSLPHEIAHCWWGNGVLVDWQGGNWSEGLTSYVADHWLQAQRSEAHGRQHRLQALRNYAAIAPEADRLALADFRARRDPATKAVGYDKAMLVFHMLQRRVGDRHFTAALRQLAGQRMQRVTGWQEIREVFEAVSGADLGGFFDQWVARPGAPRLRLAEVTRVSTDSGWRVSGRLQQTRPLYTLFVDLRLDLADGSHLTRRLDLSDESRTFVFEASQPPLGLTADPRTDLFRHLDAAEIPATINDLRGQPRIRVRLSSAAGPRAQAQAQADLLVRALGARRVAWIEADRRPDDWTDTTPLLMVGMPARGPWRDLLPDSLGLPPGDRQPSFLGVYAARTPVAPGFRVALWVPGAAPVVRGQIRRIPHYGKYSYLTFEGEQVRDKGTWPVVDSPLQVTWPAPQADSKEQP